MKTTADLSCTIGTLALDSPVIVASGVWPMDPSLWPAGSMQGVGAICSKGLTLEPKTGNEGTRLCETPCGVLNSIGLENPGIRSFLDDFLPLIERTGAPVILNVAFGDCGELGRIFDVVSETPGCISAVELNVSCPNVRSGGMEWGKDPLAASEAVKKTRAMWNGPLWVKLSPQAPDIGSVAVAVEESGADALVVANTWLGTAIDVNARKPVFKRVFAGLSGPAVFPLALRLVWDVAARVSIPVIGCGGITRHEHALAMIMAGARAVEIGSGQMVSANCARDIRQGIETYLDENGFSSLAELCGAARLSGGNDNEC
ncbi:MAG: dihydroorotate dehydrogenase [Synergistota bacterium]|nr:dihydroorotate dehydrogenase [Synergistota bacterium]